MDQGTMTLLLYMVVFFGIIYFFMIRPQQKQAKQRRAMLDSLRVNDKIITAGGIHGKIRKVKEDSVLIQIADKVEIEVSKNGIGSVQNRDVVAEKEKKAADKADKQEDAAEQEKVAD